MSREITIDAEKAADKDLVSHNVPSEVDGKARDLDQTEVKQVRDHACILPIGW